MSWTQRLKLWWLKRRAKRVYLQRAHLFDVYDCGGHMIDVITGGRLSRLDRELDTLMDQIREIDPKAPRREAA